MTSYVYTTDYASPSTYYSWTGLNNLNMVAGKFTMPETGFMDTVWIHGGGYNTTAYCFHCVWDNTSAGNKLGNSGTITWASGRAWIAGTFGCELNKDTYWMGFWCNPSYDRQYSNAPTNINDTYRVTNTSSDNNLQSGSYENRTMCAYISYTPAQVRVWNGSAWTPGRVHRWDGSAWQDVKAVYAYSGGWAQSKIQ